MTLTSNYPVIVEGVRLDTLAWNITEVTPQVAALRSQGVVLPGVDGETYDGWEDSEPAAYGLSMWVRGTDVDGVVPGVGSIATLESNLDSLAWLFRGTRHRALDLRRVVDQAGTQRQALAVVRDTIQPTITPGSVAEFSVGLVIPEGVWRDPATRTGTYAPFTTGSGAILEVGPAAGGTAPIHDSAWVLRGPMTNPRLTDVATGAFMQYGGTLADGQGLYLDSATWTAKLAAAGPPTAPPTASWRDAWAGSPSVMGAMTWGYGTSRMLTLVPAQNVQGNPADRRVKVALTATGMGANTFMWSETRRRFFT